MMWGNARACALGAVVLIACLPDNPEGTTATESDTSATDPSASTDTTGPGATGLLGCPAGEVCPLVFVAQTLDDRVEVFAPRHGPAFRGTIAMDLKPGTNPAAGVGTLDEPFGMSLSGGFLHVIAGHYPMRTSGSMVSFPTSFLAGYEPPATVTVGDYFNAGAFTPPVVHANFAEVEPIFLYEDDVQGRLLVGTFNNDLFDSDDAWVGVGKLVVADANDPATFASVDLSGLMGGDCLGASEVVLTGSGNQAAVACDANEAIAFLNLGEIGTGEVAAAAAAVGGSLCEIPGPRSNRRVRYMAPDGVGGVLVTYGPTPLDPTADGVVYRVGPDCSVALAEVGTGGAAQLGELVSFSPGFWLVASDNIDAAQRGVVVLQGGATLEVCGTVGGLEAAWATSSVAAGPVGLAVTSDLSGLAIGATPFNAAGNDQTLGKVLWAELAGTDNPCTMTATVTDLTDGIGDHAPASNPADPTTWRRAPSVVVIEEVAGG